MSRGHTHKRRAHSLTAIWQAVLVNWTSFPRANTFDSSAPAGTVRHAVRQPPKSTRLDVYEPVSESGVMWGHPQPGAAHKRVSSTVVMGRTSWKSQLFEVNGESRAPDWKPFVCLGFYREPKLENVSIHIQLHSWWRLRTCCSGDFVQ